MTRPPATGAPDAAGPALASVGLPHAPAKATRRRAARPWKMLVFMGVCCSVQLMAHGTGRVKAALRRERREALPVGRAGVGEIMHRSLVLVALAIAACSDAPPPSAGSESAAPPVSAAP